MYINGIEGKSGKYELRKAKEKMVGKTNFRKESEENAPSSKLLYLIYFICRKAIRIYGRIR